MPESHLRAAQHEHVLAAAVFWVLGVDGEVELQRGAHLLVLGEVCGV